MLSVDLNLLAVFDALYDLRGVTRAAERLNLTQSAVSHALRRLREAAGDPLFLRSGGALQPTARAREMAPDVREGLARLRAAMVPSAFDPATSERGFTLAAGSYFCALLVPRLVARARDLAPGVTFRVVPPGGDLLTALDEGSVDLALGAVERVPERLLAEPLFREELVWIAARGHPLALGAVTREAVLARPHLGIAVRRAFEPLRVLPGEEPPEATTVPGPSGGPVPALVYDALTAAAVVARTDLTALVPRRLALAEAERLGLVVLEVEGDARGEARGIELGMVSHGRSSGDAGLAWLREQVRELSR